jgi:hypothetical protein
MDKKFYVYVHYKLSDDSPFYVGKGSKNRESVSEGRSKWWKHIVDKHGYYSLRVASFAVETDAFQKEISLISDLKFLGFTLCNLTSGGEGASGCNPSTESRLKMSVAKLSKEKSIETREKMSAWQIGRKPTEETLKKMSESKVGKTGQLHNRFSGIITATHINSGETILISGNKHMAELGFSQGNISECLRGKRKSHKGYTFSR